MRIFSNSLQVLNPIDQRKPLWERVFNHKSQSSKFITFSPNSQKKRTIAEMGHVGRTVSVTTRRLSVLEHLRAENWELIRLTTSLSGGLAKAINEYSAARTRFEHLLEELAQIMAESDEQQKVLDELAVSVPGIASASDSFFSTISLNEEPNNVLWAPSIKWKNIY